MLTIVENKMAIQKFEVGQKIRYLPEHEENRPEQDLRDGIPNEYTVLAVNSHQAYIYPKDNPRGIVGSSTGAFTWAVGLEQAELISEPIPKEPPFELVYDEPEEDEFSDDCVEDCLPGKHKCK